MILNSYALNDHDHVLCHEFQLTKTRLKGGSEGEMCDTINILLQIETLYELEFSMPQWMKNFCNWFSRRKYEWAKVGDFLNLQDWESSKG